jgi:predicted extracellular nuclease
MRDKHSSLRQSSFIIIFVLCLVMMVSGCTRIAQPTLGTEVNPAVDQFPTQDQTTVVDPTVTAIPTHSQGPKISEIQGAGHVSTFENQEVNHVHGIVTVIRADGFYLQSVIPDADPATSEGIYVFQGLVPSVRPGDEVLVSGVVKERVTEGDAVNDLTITQIRFPEIEVLSRGSPLPSPIVIGEGGRKPPTEVINDSTQGRVMAGGDFNPEAAGLDFFESLEGMLVQVNNAVVVGATNRYKEIVVLPDGAAWAGVRTPRGGIVVREGDFNPERVILDDALLELPFVQVGDTATGPIVGVMDYTYGNFKLQPIERVMFTSGGLQPSDQLAPAEPGQIRAASYNVAVLSAREPNRLAVLADQIVNGMASPDIIGLQEVADNDGIAGTLAISADATYQGLIEAIAAMGGPPYAYVDIDPLPGQDGGIPDANIRVGFLYRLDRGLVLVDAPHGDAETAVSVEDQGGTPTLSLNPGRVDPMNCAFTNSRKPLAVMFMLDGRPLYVINNHFNSKGGDHSLFGAVQPPILSSEVQRIQQAQIVHDFVASILAIDPNSRVIVMGDLNDFHFSAPVGALKGEHLHNLIETLPVEERYTYNYDGNSQVLDHILVSEGLMGSLAAFEVLHLNSEFDYMRQFSDHDPVVATFWWE